MKLRNQLFWGASLALAMGCSSTLHQPCTVGRAEGGPYLATATLVSGTCSAANNGWDLGPDHFLLDVEKFGDTATEFGKHVAIIPDAFLSGGAVPLSATASTVGDLTSDLSEKDPDAKDAAGKELATCSVPTFQAPACVGAECFSFSNLKFLTEPGFQGAEMGFDLEYTDPTGCTNTYKVIALQPGIVGCLDENDVPQDSKCHWDTIATDPTCNTVTGLLANVPAHCNVDLGLCEVTGTFPVTGPGFSCATGGYIP